MMQIAEALEHPRFAAAVAHVGERLKPALPLGRVGRQCRHHELEARLAVGVFDARQLRAEKLAPRRDLAHGQLESEGDVVSLGERQARH
jgi:hypothetical protein